MEPPESLPPIPRAEVLTDDIVTVVRKWQRRMKNEGEGFFRMKEKMA